MLALAHHYDELLTSTAGRYRARVYGQAMEDGMWGGWIVFFPVGGGRVIATDRETTQSNLDQLAYWASGLTHTYLHGALDRALTLQPEATLSRELDRLERLESAAATRAVTLEGAAEVARAEAELAHEARELTEERFLNTVAEEAEADAVVHEQAADAARRTAQAADGALRARAGKTRSRSAKKKK